MSRKEGIGTLGACIETNVADERLSDTAHEALVGDQSGLTEEYKACARRAWDELVNLGNLETFEKVYAPDILWHEPEADIRGSEETKRFIAM